MSIFWQIGQIILYLSTFIRYTLDMSTDIIVTAKIYILCQSTHVYFKDVLDRGYNRFTW